MKKLVKLVKLNSLQYNPNRDPQVYRRVVGEPFRIQAVLDGTGTARVTVKDAVGSTLAAKDVATPGVFEHKVAFPSAGTHIVTLDVERGSERYSLPLRLDVLDHAWIG